MSPDQKINAHNFAHIAEIVKFYEVSTVLNLEKVLVAFSLNWP